MGFRFFPGLKIRAPSCAVGRSLLKPFVPMPTYEYECAKCGKTFDFFQSMKDELLKTCPNKKCKGKVKRLIGTGAGLIFKGSGFYITDYRSEGYKAAAKKDSSGTGEVSKPSGGDSGKASGDSGKAKTEPAKPAKSK